MRGHRDCPTILAIPTDTLASRRDRSYEDILLYLLVEKEYLYIYVHVSGFYFPHILLNRLRLEAYSLPWWILVDPLPGTDEL